MQREIPIQAVTFDVGGTLLTPDPSVGQIYARVAAQHGLATPDPLLLERRFHLAWSHLQPFQHTRDDWLRLVDLVFDGLTPRPPSETFFPELYDAFARPTAWRVFDDVVPTLESLAAAGIDLAVISNWDERLRPLLRDLRLDRYFTGLVISSETGFAKPSPVVFGEALRLLGLPAAAVLHVGDSLREDFSGAVTAGLHALHLRRDAPSLDLQIQSLTDIIPTTGLAHLRSHDERNLNFLSPDG